MSLYKSLNKGRLFGLRYGYGFWGPDFGVRVFGVEAARFGFRVLGFRGFGFRVQGSRV